MSDTGTFDFNVLWKTPLSMVTGIALGLFAGWLFALLFKKFHLRDMVKIIVLLSFSFLFVALENAIKKYVPFSGLLAVIAMGAMLYRFRKECA